MMTMIPTFIAGAVATGGQEGSLSDPAHADLLLLFGRVGYSFIQIHLKRTQHTFDLAVTIMLSDICVFKLMS